MKKNDQTKQLFLEQLKKTPIVQIACEKLSISRASFYRWKAEDVAFAQATDEAILEGYMLVNDLAESQLIGSLKDRDLRAVMYWLKHHHPVYRNRLEIEGTVKTISELSPEQTESILRAFKYVGLNPKSYDNNSGTESTTSS